MRLKARCLSVHEGKRFKKQGMWGQRGGRGKTFDGCKPFFFFFCVCSAGSQGKLLKRSFSVHPIWLILRLDLIQDSRVAHTNNMLIKTWSSLLACSFNGLPPSRSCLTFYFPSFQLSVFYYVCWNRCGASQRQRISQHPSPPPPPPHPLHPGLSQMKGAAQGQWTAGGVCAMRGPQTQTQHNPQLCGPPQLGWNVTCFRI